MTEIRRAIGGRVAPLLALAGAALAGCEQVADPCDGAAPEAVEIRPPDTTLLVGQQHDYDARHHDDAEVDWTVDDTVVAAVDDTGLVQALASGETVILAGHDHPECADGSGTAGLTVRQSS